MRVLFGACILLRFQHVIRILVEKTTLIVLNSHSTLYFTRSHNRTHYKMLTVPFLDASNTILSRPVACSSSVGMPEHKFTN